MCSRKRALGVIASVAMLSVVSVCAQSVSNKGAPASGRPAKISSAVKQDPGEKAFQANCGRCHKPPDQLSPRISGTVLRHMRVRASLSATDEREILRFIAP
jgi:cytochrome c5